MQARAQSLWDFVEIHWMSVDIAPLKLFREFPLISDIFTDSNSKCSVLNNVPKLVMIQREK